MDYRRSTWRYVFKSQNTGPTLESEGLDKKHMKAGFICTDSGLNFAELTA